jgi:predicted transcriptional regulator
MEQTNHTQEQPVKYWIIDCHVNDRDIMIPLVDELKRLKQYFIVSLHTGKKTTSMKRVSKKVFEKQINQ